MNKKERVLLGIRQCTSDEEDGCANCPYDDGRPVGCINRLLTQARELILEENKDE